MVFAAEWTPETDENGESPWAAPGARHSQLVNYAWRMSSAQLGEFRSALSRAARAFRLGLVDQMRALDVHAGQNFMLEQLRAEQPLTTGELARRMEIEVPTAVRMARRMEATGLLQRQADPADARRVLISLTRQGRRVAQVLPRRLDAVSERAFRDFTEIDRQTLIELLKRVTANLSQPPEHN